MSQQFEEGITLDRFIFETTKAHREAHTRVSHLSAEHRPAGLAPPPSASYVQGDDRAYSSLVAASRATSCARPRQTWKSDSVSTVQNISHYQARPHIAPACTKG